MFVNTDNGARPQGSGEPALRPTPSTQEITDKLSGLFVGQRVLAEIQSVMPNGSYRALVNQRSVTLALPFAAKTGDAIELEVTASDGKLTLAVVAPGGTEPSATSSAAIHLSQTGRLIHDLLVGMREGSSAPSALALNGNRPIAEQPPENGQDLSPLLQKAIRQSGMFYESHQAEWVAGRLAQSDLSHEPQARLTGRTGVELGGMPVEAAFENTGVHRGRTLAEDSAENQTRMPAETRTGTQAGQSRGEVSRQAALSLTLPGGIADSKGGMSSPVADGDRQSAMEKLPSTVNAPAVGQGTGGATVSSAAAPLPFSEGLMARVAVRTEPLVLPTAQNEDPLLGMKSGSQVSEPPNSSDVPERAVPLEVTANRLRAAASRQWSPNTLVGSDHLAANIDKRSDSQAAIDGEAVPVNANHPSGQAGQSAASAAMPAALQAIVQQQLEAFATQHFSWQGQIWPGQQMHWEIEDHSQRRDADGNPSDGSEKWQTRLRLILPRLGEIDARLQIRDQQATLTLLVDNAQTRETLRSHGADLQAHLADTGLTLAALGVIQPPPESPDTAAV